MRFLSIRFLLSCLFALSFSAKAEVETKAVDYGAGKFEGFMTKPKNAKGNLPTIIMVHNWAGVSDETKTQAARFAELGYLVIGADIYGKGQRPKDQKEMGEFATKYKSDRKLFRQHLYAAFNYAKTLKEVDRKKIAVVGYCFGGTGAVELGRSGADVKGVVSFHGGLDSPVPQDGKNIKGKVLALHGAVDPYVKADDLAAWEKEMSSNKVDYKLVKYDGAVHSFTEKGAGTDASKGAAYNEVADKKSFEEAKAFLATVLK